MGSPAPDTEAPGAPLRGPRHRRLRLARGFPFVGGKKATLERLFREKGISLTPEAQARFDALPEQFLDFAAVAANTSSTTHLEAPEAAHIEAEAA